MNNPFHLCDFEAFSVTEDKKSNKTKDVPNAFIMQEIPRVLRAVIQELWTKTKYI